MRPAKKSVKKPPACEHVAKKLMLVTMCEHVVPPPGKRCPYPASVFVRLGESAITVPFCEKHGPGPDSTVNWERLTEEEFVVSRVLDT